MDNSGMMNAPTFPQPLYKLEAHGFLYKYCTLFRKKQAKKKVYCLDTVIADHPYVYECELSTTDDTGYNVLFGKAQSFYRYDAEERAARNLLVLLLPQFEGNFQAIFSYIDKHHAEFVEKKKEFESTSTDSVSSSNSSTSTSSAPTSPQTTRESKTASQLLNEYCQLFGYSFPNFIVNPSPTNLHEVSVRISMTTNKGPVHNEVVAASKKQAKELSCRAMLKLLLPKCSDLVKVEEYLVTLRSNKGVVPIC